jgi:hypothetical protein
MSTQDRMRILQMIEDGEITAAEGLTRLTALPADDQPIVIPSQPTPQPPPPNPKDFGGWPNWWLIPLWMGVGGVVFGALLMYWAYAASGFGFWFACAAFPFTVGVVIMALAAASRKSKWIHVRIKNAKGDGPRNIAISLPLPIGPTAWFFRVFGGYIPQLKNTRVDELIMALHDTTSSDNPLFVDVHDDDDGEHVQVYIG